MRVVIISDAEADLDDIFEFVAADNAVAALRLVGKLRAKALRIGDAPRAYVVRPDYGNDMRCAFYQSYTILFQIIRSQVEVLHFAHGARDLKTLLTN
jgi:plasmid stabilization system protein ParE